VCVQNRIEDSVFRLKKVISKVIGLRQSTFLEGIGLMDNILMANEVLMR